MARYDVLIVGGGHGGAQAAIALRKAKFEGSIAIVTNEKEFPYERPAIVEGLFRRRKTLRTDIDPARSFLGRARHRNDTWPARGID